MTPRRCRECRQSAAARHPSAVPTLLWAERYDAAQALADSAVAEAQASPNAMILPMVLSQRAWLALRRGDLAAAEADARAVLDAPGPPISRNRATRVLADVLIERGDLGEAEQTLEQVIADLGIGSVTAAIERHTRGLLRFAQRRFAEALSDFRTAGEIAVGGLATCPSYLPWRSDAALADLGALLRRGNHRAEARRLLRQAADVAHHHGATAWPGRPRPAFAPPAPNPAASVSPASTPSPRANCASPSSPPTASPTEKSPRRSTSPP